MALKVHTEDSDVRNLYVEEEGPNEVSGSSLLIQDAPCGFLSTTEILHRPSGHCTASAKSAVSNCCYMDRLPSGY